MKVFTGIFTIFFITVFNINANGELDCQSKVPQIDQNWIDMASPCVMQTRAQIQEELKASMQYLAMAAHFSRDQINRPGFAKMFFESASEERSHAIKLIDYLLMRGELTKDVSNLISVSLNEGIAKSEWNTAADALEDALKLEATVTKKIRVLIAECEDSMNNKTPGEKYNDYHFVDYLTGDFLEEQYHGQRELAGKLSTLKKMMENHGPLGEFLFDKKLLA